MKLSKCFKELYVYFAVLFKLPDWSIRAWQFSFALEKLFHFGGTYALDLVKDGSGVFEVGRDLQNLKNILKLIWDYIVGDKNSAR